MTSIEIRKLYINFFTNKKHKEVHSSSLIPEDRTVLLTTAGMLQFVPYLQGIKQHPFGKRLCSIQKCFRTGDIDEVGDSSHLTFFEMLGNWSLGDYFKKEAIEMSYQFLTEGLHIPIEKIWITVFRGDDKIPRDTESVTYWKSHGIPAERIIELGREDNFWIAGDSGPCGPDTEMHYDRGEQYGCNNSSTRPSDCRPGCSKCSRFVEIWNDVFMEFSQDKDSNITPLQQKNVDTGMGLERITAIMQNKETVYETDLFLPIIQKIEELSEKKYQQDQQIMRSMRIIADHIRGATMLLADGIVPTNLDRGYVLRKVIRRAIRQSRQLGIHEGRLSEVIFTIIEDYHSTYPELLTQKENILKEYLNEEQKFLQTIAHGEKEFAKITSIMSPGDTITGEQVFYLFATCGFPAEITRDLANEHGFQIDMPGFQKEMAKHAEISRAGVAKKFGGVGDVGELGSPNHTATHLLHQALRDVLGDHVEQRGSDVTAERLRFDFTHPTKLTAEEIKAVEDIVNDKIRSALSVTCEEMTPKQAKDSGAIGLFDKKYGDKVSVYTIGDYSKEICGGPHVKNTSELKNFKITKEQSSSSGVRRIKAITNY